MSDQRIHTDEKHLSLSDAYEVADQILERLDGDTCGCPGCGLTALIRASAKLLVLAGLSRDERKDFYTLIEDSATEWHVEDDVLKTSTVLAASTRVH